MDFCPVEWHDSLPSTNTCLMERVRLCPDTPCGTVIAARQQTAGRGRQQRTWEAAPGRNLTFSFLWNAPVPPDYVPSMAQAIALGVAGYLGGEGLDAAIKWPNDIQVRGRKIGGILCETASACDSSGTAIVAGIGLNVNMAAAEAAAIDQPATSMLLESGREWEVEFVLHTLLAALAAPLNAWGAGGFEAIRADYIRLTAPVGTSVRVRDGEIGGASHHGQQLVSVAALRIAGEVAGDAARPLLGSIQAVRLDHRADE